MNEQKLLSLFKAKHLPEDVSRNFQIITCDDFEHIQLEKQVWAVLETARQLITVQNISIIQPGGVIMYPGRHPEGKHEIAGIQARDIALYRLENSPWNEAVAVFIWQQISVLLGKKEPDKLTYERELLHIHESDLDVKQLTVGVLGAGDIGSAVVRRAKNEGVQVLYFSRNEKNELSQLGAKYCSKAEEIFQNCDIIVITLPLVEGTRNFVSSSLLRLARKDAMLISVSAGGVVDEMALLTHLVSSQIKVAVDTLTYEGAQFSQSPFNVTNSPNILHCFQEGRLVITPHIAYKAENSTTKLVHVLSLPLLHMIAAGTYPETIFVDVDSGAVSSDPAVRGKFRFEVCRVV